MLSSVGSTCTPSKISDVIPCLVSESAMRAGIPSALIWESVRMSTRLAPNWAISKPISSTAPAPNFSGGAQLLDLVGVVAEHHSRVRLGGDPAQLLHARVELLEVVDDRGRDGGRAE